MMHKTVGVAASLMLACLVVRADDLGQDVAVQARALAVNPQDPFLAQFAPLMTAELSFINRACDLNLEQRQEIKAASDSCLKSVVRKFTARWRGVLGWQGRIQETSRDPTELLHQELAAVLQATLEPEQRDAYDDEMAKRQAFRKRVTIENAVAIIDQRLMLTVDQRQEITESLEAGWQSGWVQSIEMMSRDNQHLPSIPDRLVEPTLNETQRRVWRTVPKNSDIVWGGLAWAHPGEAVDDFPLVENVKDVERTPSN